MNEDDGLFEAGELSIMSDRRIPIKFVSSLGTISKSQMNLLFIYVYICLILTIAFSKAHSLISRSIIPLFSSVLAIARRITYTKITSPIIQGVSTSDMVPNLSIALLQTKNLSVHEDNNPFSIELRVSQCIETTSEAAPSSGPFMSRDFFIICSINKSNLSLRQGNFAVRFKEWERHGGLASVVAFAGC